MPNWMLAGQLPSGEEARALALQADTQALMALAAELRDAGHGKVITYSRKVFIPVTQLCRDVCHYCTFAKTPRKVTAPYLPIEQVLDVARRGERAGCREALLTLGEKPELRYSVARRALVELGCNTTLEYVARVATAIIRETALLPHINAGCMSDAEIDMLRPVSGSMGIMLESASERLCGRGMPHFGSPDKNPQLRLATIERAGVKQVPFTSGILIGIGETRLERIEALLALRALHQRYQHIQEIIIQNFRAKPGTQMAGAPEPDLADLLWTIAVARLVFGPAMSIQAPPNLSPGALPQLVAAGLNDWGGVSPLTPDHVNPEAPWPQLARLSGESLAAGKYLEQRLTLYPAYARNYSRWLDKGLHQQVLQQVDGAGFARIDSWRTGQSTSLPTLETRLLSADGLQPGCGLQTVLAAACSGQRLDEQTIASLFAARGDDFAYICQQADQLRLQCNGDSVSYVVNRNINYTNVCYFNCRFCAFSKGKSRDNLRGRPYDLSLDEILRRCREAWQRGATEVCLQGGIHPHYTGSTYLGICAAIHRQVPGLHIHAFSPLEIWQGAATLGLDLKTYLAELQACGLASLPGTAAEILDDEVRAVLCPDKIDSAQWLDVMETAHGLGIPTTSTMMFGHVDSYRHWARHLLRLRDLQAASGGFTEFVPLPFVGAEAPIYRQGRARNGPTLRESILVHAVARLVLYPLITNIQTSWVKMGEAGALACLQAGANDLGGTLMNESITRAAGAGHGQELPPARIETLLAGIGRHAYQRTTLYGVADAKQQCKSFAAQPLAKLSNSPPLASSAKDGTAQTLVRNRH